eukprot:GHVP01042562.1.p1 GENE.GHVP01042562.1~~GHVP01042562.1.p1  ORF type:complete len:313 (+),score=43.97 GHVP01042562.1:453-1391(+)
MRYDSTQKSVIDTKSFLGSQTDYNKDNGIVDESSIVIEPGKPLDLSIKRTSNESSALKRKSEPPETVICSKKAGFAQNDNLITQQIWQPVSECVTVQSVPSTGVQETQPAPKRNYMEKQKQSQEKVCQSTSQSTSQSASQSTSQTTAKLNTFSKKKQEEEKIKISEEQKISQQKLQRCNLLSVPIPEFSKISKTTRQTDPPKTTKQNCKMGKSHQSVLSNSYHKPLPGSITRKLAELTEKNHLLGEDLTISLAESRQTNGCRRSKTNLPSTSQSVFSTSSQKASHSPQRRNYAKNIALLEEKNKQVSVCSVR